MCYTTGALAPRIDYSNTDMAPIRIHLRPSRWLFGFLIGSHGGALWLLPLTNLSWVWQLSLGLLVMLSAYQSLRYHVDFTGRRITRSLTVLSDAVLIDETQFAELAAGGFAHPYLVMLCLQWPDQHRETLILLPDTVDADSFRQLRLRLRHPFRP